MNYDNEILNERETSHGDYVDTAYSAEAIKGIIRQGYKKSGKKRIAATQMHSLDLIATKIARLSCGNMNELDSWEDIAGYANLISERLKKEQANASD